MLQRFLGVPDVKAACGGFKWRNRREWDMSSEEARALLGSPNGRDAGLMLITHKWVFGNAATISKVTFWCGRRELHPLFTVKR